MKVIVYKTETGIVIIHPVVSVEASLKDIPTDAEYKIIDESELPTDRTFRGAWDYDTLTEDVDKSKEIKKTSLRSERESLFTANDIDLQNAIADGDDDAKAICITERNRLRDVTDLVDTCTTIDEIKTVSVEA